MFKRLGVWIRPFGAAASLWLALAVAGHALAQTTTLLSNSGNEKRYALVIGNAAYAAAPLTNPVNDMRSMSQALREAGFEVTTAENAGRLQLLKVVREFGDKLAKSGGIGLFYFAGHGLQIKGRNYLVPVDAQVSGEDEAAYDSMDTDFVLQKMAEAKNRVNIIILDACRNNPFVKTRSTGGGGLAQIDAPVGAIVAYATAPGSVASDGAGSNGLYTQHLVTAINQKGLRVEEVFKQVRANVRRDSQGKQVPWENTALEGEFFFFPPESVAGVQQINPHSTPAPGPAVLETGATEQTAWELARSGGIVEAERFLARYPAGRFAQAAKDRLVALRVHVTVASPVQPPQAPAMQIAPPPLQALTLPPTIRFTTSPAPLSPAAPPAVAAAAAGKISLQSLSAMAAPPKNSAPEPASAAVPAPEPTPAPVPVVAMASGANLQNKVWNYTVTGAGGSSKTEQIKVRTVDGGWQQLSEGTEIHEDGRVRAVRFGSYLVKVVSSDNFLRLPLRAGLSGANTAQVIDTQGRSVNSRVIWRTEPAGSAIKLTATVDGVSFVLRYEAYFSAGQVMPVRYESEMKSRLVVGAAQVLTATMQPQ